MMGDKLKDLSAQRFGRLVVIKRVDDYITLKGKHYPMWKCVCDCGNVKNIAGSSLKRGFTKSCGCHHDESSAINGKNNKKHNVYDLSGEYGIGYAANNKSFYFDKDDYEKIKNYYWAINSSGYVSANKNTIFLHRLILDVNDVNWIDKIVDHINHDKTDNRKCNLRIATFNQNTMNSSLRSDNITGVKGVYWNKGNKNWQVQIGINGKNKYLGSFKNFEDAVKIRKEAEKKYFGEYSCKD